MIFRRVLGSLRSENLSLTPSRVTPGRVFDFETDLEGIADAYAAMDERRAIKALVRMGSVEGSQS